LVEVVDSFDVEANIGEVTKNRRGGIRLFTSAVTDVFDGQRQFLFECLQIGGGLLKCFMHRDDSVAISGLAQLLFSPLAPAFQPQEKARSFHERCKRQGQIRIFVRTQGSHAFG
jgi:hypothetical protein